MTQLINAKCIIKLLNTIKPFKKNYKFQKTMNLIYNNGVYQNLMTIILPFSS